MKKIPGNVQEEPGNVPEDSRECSKRFRGMFEEIPGNVEKIPGNAEKDSEEYILKYNKKCAQRFIKTSHMKEHV